MDRAEQRAIIEMIKDATRDAIEYLRKNKEWIKDTEGKVGELFNRFDDIGEVESLSEDDIISKVKKSLFDKTLAECKELTENFIEDLNDHIDELSDNHLIEFYEKRINKLEDKILSKFDNDEMEYSSIEEAVGYLEEALYILNDM